MFIKLADFSGLVRGNKTFGVILELLKEDTTEEIIAAIRQRFDAPEDQISGNVRKVLSELQKIGAIDG